MFCFLSFPEIAACATVKSGISDDKHVKVSAN